MADLIDRDALLKALRIECPESDVCFSHESCIDCIVKRQPAVNRWIPVEDALPEKAGEYLVTYHPCYWDHVEWSKRCAGIDTFRGKTTWAKKKYQHVIAWMPMPDAYEPQKE